ncbi:MAG: hypothetical protein ACREQ5_27980, partial [Candidatus Dormibacteria bacterium]
YPAQLEGLAGRGSAFLLVRFSAQGDFRPLINQHAVIAAAQQRGFAKRDTLQLPDGTAIDIWQR